ncbi:MAG: lipoate--protein ligase family protein [Candidatus Thorarchaeota archaeon]|nr:lipoate--protein ligase family protein [Candidatus Thorarchaeota archaeon]
MLEEDKVNVFRNLAIEEAIARVNAESTEKINTLRFWRSEPAIVLGRFQCVHKEVNIDYCRRNKIPIARRFTGGGTVFHDSGNLNFTICLDQNKPYVSRTLNELYWNFVGAIASALREVGIPANYDSNRSCLRINGRKITGTAGWIKQGVSFIHGTLLIDADLEMLKCCLEVPPNQPEYLRDNRRLRCLESKKDRVTSIAQELTNRPSDVEIKNAIISSLERISEEKIHLASLMKTEIDAADSLYQTRYSQAEWNLGTLASEF